jgi:uncharacterized protein DUF1707
MPEPHLRASDADRARVAEVLGTHMSAGRLTVAEYDERLARTYASRTYGELAELTTDLPAAGTPAAGTTAGPSGATTATPQPAAQACGSGWVGGWGHWGPGASLRAARARWLSTAAIVLVIWAATSLAAGSLIYFWPVWVIGPWGAMLLVQHVTGSHGGSPGRDRHRNRVRELR